MHPIIKRVSVILFLVFTITACCVAQHQTMAIPSGQSVSFADSPHQPVRAYCMEFHKKTPTADTVFRSFIGRVRLTYKDGTQQALTLQKAVSDGLISIDGGGSYLKVLIHKRDPLVRAVDFIEDALATEQESSAACQLTHKESAEALFASIHAAETGTLARCLESSRERVQRQLWKQGRVCLAKRSLDSLTVYSKFGLNPNHCTKMTYLGLPSGGTATLYEETTGNLLLIDSGFKKDCDNILEFIAEHHGQNRNEIRLRILVTHPHADHVGGIGAFNDRGVEVSEIICPEVPLGSARLPAMTGLSELMRKKYGYSERAMGLFSLFTKHQTKGQSVSLSGNRAQHSEEANKVDVGIQSVTLDIGGDSDIRLYRFRDAANVNDLSIVTRIAFNGVVRLDLGDAGTSVLAALLKRAKRDDALVKAQKEKWAWAKILANEVELVARARSKGRRIRILQESRGLAEEQRRRVAGDASFSAFVPSLREMELDWWSAADFARSWLVTSRLRAWEKAGWMCRWRDIEKNLSSALSRETADKADSVHRGRQTMDRIGAQADVVALLRGLGESGELLRKMDNRYKQARHERVSIKANVLQWPHHYWLPTDRLKVVEEFLLEAHPQYIIITKPGSGQGDVHRTKLMEFLEGFRQRNGRSFEVIELVRNVQFHAMLRSSRNGLLS